MAANVCISETTNCSLWQDQKIVALIVNTLNEFMQDHS